MSGQSAVGSEQPARAESSRRRVTLVVAAAENDVIGRNGDLPWRLPADLAHFKRLTMGAPLIMGRKTYDSIGRPLPGRVSIVLTRDISWRAIHDEVLVAESLEQALGFAEQEKTPNADDVFVIGGGEVYRLALPSADSVCLTRVHAVVEGDAVFPPLDPSQWRLTSSEDLPADERNEHACTFEVWERNRE